MSEYRGYTPAQKKATEKYKKENYKRVPLDMKNSEYEALKAYTEKHGEKINGFIRRIILEKINGDAGTD